MRGPVASSNDVSNVTGRPEAPPSGNAAALRDPDPAVRLRAVHRLARDHDPSALVALEEALSDASFGVRWAAATALAAHGRAGVVVALGALAYGYPAAPAFLRRVGQVLRRASLTPEERVAIAPVLAALAAPAADLAAPLAATAALARLRSRPADAAAGGHGDAATG
jgi:HEAT repeat protein